MKTVYALVGDYYHAEDNIRHSLELALQPLTDRGGLKLEYISTDALVSSLELKPAAVVLFKEDRVNPKEGETRWLTEAVSDAITAYVEAGGGFVTWHSGLASYPPESSFIRMLRGYFEYHPAKHQTVSYRGELPGSESQAVSFDLLDEHYFVNCDEANTEVFLRSESVDGVSIAGWRHSFGQGRICCLTPAHNKEGLLDSDMLEMVRSCVLDVCGAGEEE
ncbi:ThuA domain-containing protein [Paenibacillus thalictri]|uniref:Trehalose utilization n=1 Tax=Paenibacillus thalictri TaxID=2527873 RepID=A0A4Q9DHH7_9BACL|nr:ThuA domain-containing protein [Paenibacillus thalictri]TBL69715.1 trehalose utilization [Paenibacillus thalictri]